MKQSLVLGIVGHKGSGKGTIAQYLAEHHAAAHFKFSDPLTDTLKRLHLPITRDGQIRLALSFREHFGEDILGKVIMLDVDRAPQSMIAVDGIRYWDEVKLLRTLPFFRLIHVDADVRKRYERTLIRGEKANESEYSFEDFVTEHQRPTEVTIGEIAKSADVHLNNDGDFEALYRQLMEAMSRIFAEAPPFFSVKQ